MGIIIYQDIASNVYKLLQTVLYQLVLCNPLYTDLNDYINHCLLLVSYNEALNKVMMQYNHEGIGIMSLFYACFTHAFLSIRLHTID